MQDQRWKYLVQTQTDVRRDRYMLQHRVRQMEADAVDGQRNSDQLESTVQQLLTDLQAARTAKVCSSFLSHCTVAFPVWLELQRDAMLAAQCSIIRCSPCQCSLQCRWCFEKGVMLFANCRLRWNMTFGMGPPVQSCSCNTCPPSLSWQRIPM